ncbi:MAG: type II toxin-antitoxin system Phd/YefM family antitoxin [Acidimicrobiales bacterium]
MTTVPLGEAKDHLSEYITAVERTHDRVVITRHGRPAGVLISPDDLAALEETVDVLTTPGASEAIAEGLGISGSAASPTTRHCAPASPEGEPAL